MKIKARMKGDLVNVKMLLKHPMETGRRKDKAGNTIAAKHITEVTAIYNNQQVFHAEFGTSISKNPFISFLFKGEVGKNIAIDWKDNTGETERGESVIK
jgi:sulfur-oxidizing protein SoxZ